MKLRKSTEKKAYESAIEKKSPSKSSMPTKNKEKISHQMTATISAKTNESPKIKKT